MNQETYLKERVDDQIDWYDRKSMWNQNRQKRIRLLATVISLLIPLATGFLTEDTSWLKFAIGAGGVIIALCE